MHKREEIDPFVACDLHRPHDTRLVDLPEIIDNSLIVANHGRTFDAIKHHGLHGRDRTPRPQATPRIENRFLATRVRPSLCKRSAN